MDRIKRILVTTDLSDTARSAFPLARKLAETFEAEIVLAYVAESRLPPLIFATTDIGLEELEARHREHAEKQLAELAREVFGPDLTVHLAVATGIPHDEIVRMAGEREADMIVMATHGRGFVTHAILGSTAERVLRRSPCPVLVTRERKAD